MEVTEITLWTETGVKCVELATRQYIEEVGLQSLWKGRMRILVSIEGPIHHSRGSRGRHANRLKFEIQDYRNETQSHQILQSEGLRGGKIFTWN